MEYWNRLSDEQQRAVYHATRELLRIVEDHPNLSEADLEKIYRAVVARYETVVAASTLRALENSRRAAGTWGVLDGLVVGDPAPPEQIHGTYTFAVHRATKDGQEFDARRVARALAGPLGRLVRQKGRRTVWESTRAAGTRYARLPGPYACDFCLMLASRGAVYTRDTVVTTTGKRGTRPEGLAYHDHCDCVAIESYSPEDLPQVIRDLQDEWEYATYRPDGQPVENQRGAWRKHIARTRPNRETVRPPRAFAPRPGLRMEVPPTDPRPVITDRNRRHILDGEPPTGDGVYRGGHRAGTGNPGKTEFPAAWSDQDAHDGVEETLADPDWSKRSGDRRTLRRVVTKHDQRAMIEVSWYPGRDGEPVLRTGFPMCGDEVVYNGDDGPVPRPFDPDRLEEE